jgi:protein tyrosine kinase modulator
MNAAATAGRTLADYGRIVRRRWVYPATIIPALLLLAVFLAYALPASYRSFGVIPIESPSISGRVVESTVDDLKGGSRGGSREDPSYIDQQLDLVRRRVMSVSELKQVVAEIDPYPQESDLTPVDKAALIAGNMTLERVDPIKLEPLDSSPAFSVAYDNPSPAIAQTVASKIVERFITYNQRARSEQAAQAYQFLVEQAKDVESSMREMEHKLAQFKTRYGDALPDSQARNLAGVDRVQRDLDSFEEQIRTAEEKEATLQLQLNQTSPSLVAAVTDWRTEVAKLKAELAEAEQKYTPEHPDVKRLRRAVAELAASGTSADSVKSNPDNPEYLLVRSQLSSVRNDLVALRARAAKARADQAHYEEQINLAPNVERQYTDLTRSYETETSRYQDLQTKIKSAALAQRLESEARGERFTLIRAANLPSKPQSPNRLGIILIGFVLGAAIALGAAALVEASDPSVRGVDDLQEIFDTPPIGAVPLIRNRREIRHRRLVIGSVTTAYAAATGFVVFTIMSAT